MGRAWGPQLEEKRGLEVWDEHKDVRAGGFPCLPWRPKPQLGAGAGAEEVLPDVGGGSAGRARHSDGAQLLFPVVSGNTVPIFNTTIFYVPEDLELGE